MKTTKGFTLIELAIALGIVGTLSIVDAQQDQVENRQIRAKNLGKEIFQYNTGVNKFLAEHRETPDAALGTYTGSDWLKGSDCDGGLASEDYLECHLIPDGKTRHHHSEPQTTITKTPNGGLEARTVWSTALLSEGGPDAASMGIAAMVASGAYVASPESLGGGYQGPTVFCPDIDAYSPSIDRLCGGNKNKIVSLSSTNSQVREWLRVDHSNTMQHVIEFDNGNTDPLDDSALAAVDGSSVRQIVNVARIYNVGDMSDGRPDAIAIGSMNGNNIYTDSFLVTNDLLNNSVIVDADEAIIGDMYARANMYVKGNLLVENGSIQTITGDIISGSDAVATNNVTAEGGDIRAVNGDVVAAVGGMSAENGVVHGDKIYARVFHDTSLDNLKADGVTPKDFADVNGYVLNPNDDSRLDTVEFMGMTVFHDFIRFGAEAHKTEFDESCAPEQEGMITSTAQGKLLSCENGWWVPPAPDGMYGYFATETCPTGWVEADGNNGTVNLRGQFVRSWNPGSGLDSGRSVGSQQNHQTYLSRPMYQMDFGFTDTGRTEDGINSMVSPSGLVVTDDLFKYSPGSAYEDDPVPMGEDWRTHESRPTNVALLACVRQ